MNYQERYDYWVSNPQIDSDLKNELLKIEDNEIEKEERFYKELAFGTGGLRGIIGAGSNRINKHTVGRATQGLANYLLNNVEGEKSCAIAYDSRNFSKEFALDAALVLAANGVKTYLFEDLRPTPELSYAVRSLKCDAGIVITASHNPKEYNGYKVYGADGGQVTLDIANIIISEINNLDVFTSVKTIKEEDALNNGMLTYLGQDMDDEYLDKVMGLSLRPDLAKAVDDFKVIFTPIHGTGLKLVTEVLEKMGYDNVMLVKEQCEPDGNFPTVKSPNPEEREAFTLGIEMAKKEDADLLFGTDPDADRVGVVMKNGQGEYQVLTGNQIGALLTHYILSSQEKVTEKDAVIKTIVTSEFGATIAKALGATVFDTLTGFKFIGEKIKGFEENGDYNFLFGYEESYGYLSGTFVRDKDAVIASALITEMAAYYKVRGLTLFDGLKKLYETYGYFVDALETHTYKDVNGQAKIASIVEKFRNLDVLKGQFPDLVAFEDFQSSEKTYLISNKKEVINLPKSNVVKLHLEDESWIAIRPSGTEPKLKIYYSSRGDSQSLADERMKELKLEANAVIADKEDK